MPNNDHSELFGAWLDDRLTAEQRQQFEQLCSIDEQFAQQVQTANTSILQAKDYTQQPAPTWNREASWPQQTQSRWWQWSGLPALSMACSIFAVVLVFSGFEAKVEQGALTISFQSQSEKVEKLVEQRLAQFAMTQQQALTDYAQSLREQQLDASTQLTNYLLASSRQERKEDFGELIKFINEQRSDDQMFYTRQLNELQNEIYSNPALQP